MRSLARHHPMPRTPGCTQAHQSPCRWVAWHALPMRGPGRGTSRPRADLPQPSAFQSPSRVLAGSSGSAPAYPAGPRRTQRLRAAAETCRTDSSQAGLQRLRPGEAQAPLTRSGRVGVLGCDAGQGACRWQPANGRPPASPTRSTIRRSVTTWTASPGSALWPMASTPRATGATGCPPEGAADSSAFVTRRWEVPPA